MRIVSITSRLIPALVLALVLTLGTGCNDNNVTVEGGIPDADAAALVATAIGSGSSTAGITSQLEEAVYVSVNGKLPKVTGTSSPNVVLLDTTITRTKTGTYSYNYTARLVFDLVTANTMNFTFGLRGTYDTPNLASDDTSHAAITISDLSSPALRFNGSYTRLGSETFKNSDLKQFTSQLIAQLSDVTVEKATRKASGGTMNINLTGQFSGGSRFEVIAVVTFKGNGQATIVINGKTFNVDLATCTVTPA
jgi:hypothetical protein